MADAALDERLAAEGFFVERGLPAEDVADPWAFAARVCAEPVQVVERQIIRAVPGGRSFASTSGPAPLHNDLQLFRGRPADLQIMRCVRPAHAGGTSILLDVWAVLDRLRHEDAALSNALFEVDRTSPFIAGTLVCPTVARFDGRTSVVCSPQPSSDPLEPRLRAAIDRAPARPIDLAAGDVLVVDNHRVLHGRTAFAGGARELVRFLVWLGRTRPVPEAVRARARTASIRPAAGMPGDERAIAVVVRMLEGASPGALAAEHAVPEPVLYAWRDALYERALAALGRCHFAS